MELMYVQKHLNIFIHVHMKMKNSIHLKIHYIYLFVSRGQLAIVGFFLIVLLNHSPVHLPSKVIHMNLPAIANMCFAE